MLIPIVDPIPQPSASDYFQRIIIHEKLISQQRIKTILAAAILRYLGGITTLQFVLELYITMKHQIDMTTNNDLLEINLSFAELEHQITCKNRTKQIIDMKLRDILEKLIQF